MTVMMKCGHAANSRHKRGDGTYEPSCVICCGISAGWNEIDEKGPDLTGRISRCDYFHTDKCKRGGGNYTREAPSSPELPFFEHTPKKEFDRHYCGCHGWD